MRNHELAIYLSYWRYFYRSGGACLYLSGVNSEKHSGSAHSLTAEGGKSPASEPESELASPMSFTVDKPSTAPPSPPSKQRRWPRPRSPADEEARRIIRGAMERCGIGYTQLAAILEPRAHQLGIGRLTEHNLASRISRGSFTFGFAIEVLRAMGIAQIDITPVRSIRHPPNSR